MTPGPVITGWGMVSSLGLSHRSTCAAIRAGLSRPAQLDLVSLDPSADEPVATVGHPAGLQTDGFASIGRWLRLSQAAFADLRASLKLSGEEPSWDRTLLVVVAPRVDAARHPELADGLVAEDYASSLTELLDLPAPWAGTRVLTRGSVGTSEGLGMLLRLDWNRFTQAVIIAADSYLDDASLAWLAETGRLKAPTHPVGLAPGELGVAALVEQAGRRAVRASGLTVVASEMDLAKTPEIGGPALGKRLADCARRALASLDRPPDRVEVLADLNGEEWRARAWAEAELGLGPVLPARRRLQVPARSVGDVGAPSALLSLGLHAYLAERAQPRPPTALVVGTTEYGDAAAIVAVAETP